MTEFVAALVGALVGGFAASYGSFVVAKRLTRYNARLRLYQELIPQFEPSRSMTFGQIFNRDKVIVGPKPMSTDEVLEAMERTAVVLPRRDRQLVTSVREARERRLAKPADDDPRWKPRLNTQTGEVIKERGEIDLAEEEAALKAALDALDKRLEKKLR